MTSRPRPLLNRASLISISPTLQSKRLKVNNYPEERYGLDYYYSKGMYGDYNHPSKSATNSYYSSASYYGSSNEFKKLALIVLVPLTLCLVLFTLLSFSRLSNLWLITYPTTTIRPSMEHTTIVNSMDYSADYLVLVEE